MKRKPVISSDIAALMAWMRPILGIDDLAMNFGCTPRQAMQAISAHRQRTAPPRRFHRSRQNAQAEDRMAWCPPERRKEYWRLIYSGRGVTTTEARRIIEADMAREARRCA